MPNSSSRRVAATPASVASQAIGLLREHSLATLAQQELEGRILSGQIAGGTKLNEVDVAAALGVSRGPVREAFRALSQAGLVRVEKNRGVFVRQVSLEEASEFYEVRAALEGLIGRLAARRIALDEVEQLRAVVRRMQQLPRSRRGEDYFALNVEFHDLLARAARNNALLANYRGVVNQLDLYRRATISRGTEHIPASTQEHEAIVEAVAARDEPRAEALLTRHVLLSRERLQAALGPAG
jgi:DNA-binding GntR family transcriptional regulator